MVRLHDNCPGLLRRSNLEPPEAANALSMPHRATVCQFLLKLSTAKEPGRFRLINYALCVFNVFCIGWWIGSIERTLQYNSVYGVYGAELFSAGQLIPLCVGVLGLVKVAFDCRTARKDRQQREENPQHWACERCLRDHRARECSLTATAPTAVSEIRRKRSALLAAWLPWLMVFLYPPVDDAEAPARYSHRRY